MRICLLIRLNRIAIYKHLAVRMRSKWRVLTFLLCVSAIGVLLRKNDLQMISRNLFQQLDTNTCFFGKCLAENDTWFLQRINQPVEPFLSANYKLSEDTFNWWKVRIAACSFLNLEDFSKRNAFFCRPLSEDAFNWWKVLQEEKRSFSTYSKTVDRLFQIFPSSPRFMEPNPQVGRTCAVVGNSANLKGSHYGSVIDFHNVIIRINHGQTKSYEADVGNRTTHRIMYPESATDLDNTTRLVLFPFKIQDLEWLITALTARFYGKSYVPIKSNIKANKSLVMVMNPAFMRYVHDVWLEKKGEYPSTGFMAVVLALHLCDVVDVFGFGADKDGNWSHYWEELEDKNFKTGIHPGIEEYNIIQWLAERQKLKFYKGL